MNSDGRARRLHRNDAAHVRRTASLAVAESDGELRHQVVVKADGASIDRFFRTVAIDGELSDEQRRRLLDIAERCPVSRALRGGSEIVTQS